MTDPKYPIDIEAEIYFLTPEEGGRTRPIFSGYRPQFFYDNHDWDAIQNFVGIVGPIQPGQIVTAQLSFLSPQAHVGKLYPGKEFLLREGGKVVGKGHVTKIVDLEKSATKAAEKEAKRHGISHDAT